MNTVKPRISGKSSRRFMITLVGLVMMSTLTIGCQSSDSDTGPATLGLVSSEADEGFPRMAPPTIGEISAEVELTSDQLQPMETALDRWSETAQSRWAERQANKNQPRRGEFRPRTDRERPMFTFLEESAGILNADQFVDLVEFLAERRESHREAKVEARQGRRGEFHGPHDGKAHGARIEQLAEKLDLTEQQQADIQEVFEESRDAMRTIHQQHVGTEPDESLREQRQEIRTETQEKIENILSPEQYAQWEGLKTARRSQMAERRAERQGLMLERRVESLVRILGLDDSQREQVSDILTGAMEQAKALRGEIRNNDTAREEVREKRKQIKEETEAAIKALLAPEQTKMLKPCSRLNRPRCLRL